MTALPEDNVNEIDPVETESPAENTEAKTHGKIYLPDESSAEFVLNSLSLAWNTFEELLATKLGGGEENETWVKNICSTLRSSHIGTAIHAADLIDNYNYNVLERKEHDEVVGFLLQNSIAGIRNHYSAIPRRSFSLHPAEMDADTRWKYGPLPMERALNGEKIPMRLQTLQDTIFGYYELMIKRVLGENNQIIEYVTTIPAIRTKKGYLLPNTIWRWHEVEERDVKQAWLMGRDLVTAKKAEQPKTNHPIDNTDTEADSDGRATTQESIDS